MNIDRAVGSVAVMIKAVGSPSAGTVNMHVLGDAFLKGGHGHHDLEGRARCELRLDGLVHQRPVRVGRQLVPVGTVNSDGKLVGGEAGTGDEGENFTGARVHGDDGTV